MQDLLIRQADENDLRSLQIFLPSDIPGFNAEVLSEFKAKKATWILAINANIQVGHIRIRWKGSRNKYVKQIFAIPNIEALGVMKEFRLKGIGSQLLTEAEKEIKSRGYNNSGLAVESNNEKLKHYYAKKGYLDWDKGVFTSQWKEKTLQGTVIKRTEEYTYMLKMLQ